MTSSFYSIGELQELGLKYFGKDVKVSKKASIFNPSKISIGDCSRVDDFCTLSAGSEGIEIGRNVHIAVYTSLIGKEIIRVKDFANISSRVAIYSSNDDYSGNFMTNPTVDPEFTNVMHAPVVIEEHVIIGSGSVIVPGVILKKGACVGTLSFVNKDCNEFSVYAGVPALYIKDRSKNLLEVEKEFVNKNG